MLLQHFLYPQSLEEAKAAQEEMAQRVRCQDGFSKIARVGAMDVSNNRADPEQRVYAVCVVLERDTQEIIEKKGARERQEFPYIPGFLGFREAPSLVHAFEKIEKRPDLLFVDGHGISHPRRLGIASHIGVVLDIPTIGIAKNILVGKLAKPLGEEKGSMEPLVWKGQVIAMAYRSRLRAKPIYISVGHQVSLETAIELALPWMDNYRLPKPIREAHRFANELRCAFLHGKNLVLC